MTSNKPADAIPYTVSIKDGEDAMTWRAYPGPATTIGEMMQACEKLDLRAWVDLDGEVCLICNEPGRVRIDLPDVSELVSALWGLDTDPNAPAQGELLDVPAFLRRQAD